MSQIIAKGYDTDGDAAIVGVFATLDEAFQHGNLESAEFEEWRMGDVEALRYWRYRREPVEGWYFWDSDRLEWLPRTSVPIDAPPQGLYPKYRVTRVSDGSLVDSCFVLRPRTDHAAFRALRTYAMATPNTTLALDLDGWLSEIAGEVHSE